MNDFDIKDEFFKLKDNFAKNTIIKEVKKRQLFQKYFNEYDIKQHNDEDNLNRLFQNFCLINDLKTKQDLSYYLLKTRITKDELSSKMLYDQQLEELKKRVITKQEILDFYLDKKYSMENVVFSLVRVEEEELIYQIYERIQNGEEIEFFSRRYSKGKESKQNGLVGPISLAQINPLIKNKLQNMNRGEISEPFKLGDGMHYIVKLHWLEGSEIDEKTERKLRNILFEKWVEDQLNLENLVV